MKKIKSKKGLVLPAPNRIEGNRTEGLALNRTEGLALNRTEGFTLIEMMVVIAIIGFLSASILAGVGSARKKARDSRIQSIVQQAMSIIETYYDPTTGKYPDTGVVALDAEWLKLNPQVKGLQGSTEGMMYLKEDPNKYRISAILSSDSKKIYCSDSEGTNMVVTTLPAGASCK